MRTIAGAALTLLAMSTQPLPAGAQTVAGPADLKPFNVTIRRFDLFKGPSEGTDFVLPVDSPDAEHACASTLANAAAFSKKIDGDKPLPIGFTCAKTEKR